MTHVDDQDKPNPFWRVLTGAERDPDMFVWLGDIVYADKLVAPLVRVAATAAEIEHCYAVREVVFFPPQP